MSKKDYLFREPLTQIDPDVAELIRHETARQARYLIMIPSESTSPLAVRDTLSSSFHNIYAEGYPSSSTRTLKQDEILDYDARLAEYRRSSDERYYKGTEYADVIEALARRRTAEVFSANGYSPEQLFVNVQPLSGAPANNAVYSALVNVGDTVMGMDLIEGGHLSHGSPVNRSGLQFNIISYGVDPETNDINYEQMAALAQKHRPKMIIGGYSSFPYQANWQKYREIADSVGAYLLADIAHVAGLVAAGIYPSPIGIADVVSFTTHKTLNGPRGAVIITHKKSLAAKIDRAVFPGEQGGPHMNTITGIAVAMKIASTDEFKELQTNVVKNASLLAKKLSERGVKVAYGGTNTHMFSVDCQSIQGEDGTPLSGDMAARILDLAGIVCNRQTIPGDKSALRPSGFRMGTPWVTQRGFGEDEINQLGDIIADILLATKPFSYPGRIQPQARAKIDFEILQNAKLRVRDLAASVGIDTDAEADGYPHFYYLEEKDAMESWQTLQISGNQAKAFLDVALTSDVLSLANNEEQATNILNPDGDLLAKGTVKKLDNTNYQLIVNKNAGYIVEWLRSLSDGFVLFDPADVYAKVPGPVAVHHVGSADSQDNKDSSGYAKQKAYFIGRSGKNYSGPQNEISATFEWEEKEADELLTTSLHSLHKALGAKMVPFAGYDMPVWYTSVTEEHNATRQHSGIFDVTHMGVFDVIGPGAVHFLDTVMTNEVASLNIGQSHYTYLLNIDGIPFDDLMIYRLGEEHYLVVVNASNNDKNWAWLNAVKNGEVIIDPDNPARAISRTDNFVLRDLRNPAVGDEMRVDVALQGPESTNILLALGASDEDKKAVAKLPWAGVTKGTFGAFDLIVSRTGYTGERVAYELFVHPDQAAELFKQLVDLGAVPCGLAARDSLRTEAGLPLYGHELAGPLSMGPSHAGFGTYVKLWKPFFIGKSAYLANEKKRDAKVVRFRLDNKGARPPHQGDPLVDNKGRVVGIVTSCSIDSEGYQLGQALVKEDSRKVGTQLGVFAGSERAKPIAFDNIQFGKKIAIPDTVTIISRFPKQ